jgi:diguanylate cyclase (GGDEF)-like protein/putative nucleotidyltransferase with HDIG domain
VLGRRDIALLVIFAVVVLPDIRGLQFAGATVFFYLPLAFVTSLLPCVYITRWLLHQAPERVPVYEWIMRLLGERWRSFVLFLTWWLGVLTVFSLLGLCLCALQVAFPRLLATLPLQCLVFTCLLVAAMVITCLPMGIFRVALWICGLLYLSLFLLLGLALVVRGRPGGRVVGAALPSSLSHVLPGSFSWLFFGMALLSLLAVSAPLLMDGEMRGKQNCLRTLPCPFWWGGLGAFVVCLAGTAILLALGATADRFPLLPIGQVFGPDVLAFACLCLVAGYFGSALTYLLLFSRALFHAARLGYMPRKLAYLNHAGVPLRAFLTQYALIVCGACVVFIVLPLVAGGSISDVFFSALILDNQFGLLSSVAGALWAWITTMIFAFALWVFCKKKRARRGRSSSEWVLVPVACVLGAFTMLICVVAPLLRGWPMLFFSHNNWFSLVVLGIVSSLVLGWLVSELPRRSALLREKERRLVQEKMLRGELQRAYERECDLHNRLRESYDEQQVSILQQKILLDDLNRLYREQERAAVTDSVTGLPNHRAFIKQLDEEVECCQTEGRAFLLFFVDLDHFKDVNDTWGHLAGDAVLAEVACRLCRTVQPEGFVGRYGGEEFALIIPNETLKNAYRMAQRLRTAVNAEPYAWRCGEETMTGIAITASIGVAAYAVHGRQREELIKTADRAMYQAKLEGRDRIHLAGMPSPGESPTSLIAADAGARKGGYLQRLFGDEGAPALVSVQAVQALAAVVRVRDHELGSHSYRMIRLAEETARRMSLTCKDLLLIRLGSLLHDIGKIGVPDAILHKPGPLNEEEWTFMHKHPMLGARILGEVDGYFQLLAQIVISHHERWDGQGYPRGLVGEEIPLAARILSVVDAYDAMVSRRPYKEPVSIAAAEAELRRCAGTQFDPLVVEIFLGVPKNVEPGRACVKADLPHRVDAVLPGPHVIEEPGSTFMRSRATGESGSGGAGCAVPSPRSDEYARGLA